MVVLSESRPKHFLLHKLLLRVQLLIIVVFMSGEESGAARTTVVSDLIWHSQRLDLLIVVTQWCGRLTGNLRRFTQSSISQHPEM